MFKKSGNSKMSLEKFGVGSTFFAEQSTLWMVIGGEDNMVEILDCKTMLKVKNKSIMVEDQNHLTQQEVISLVHGIGQYTFSDFTFSPRGLKQCKE